MASENAYILELFSGNGTVSKVARLILGCPYLTIDYDETIEPSLYHMCFDIHDWNKETKDMIQKRWPDRRPVIFASPPCEEYSKMKTCGERDLEYADKCVLRVKEIAEQLDAWVVILENPRTGMLKDREVIKRNDWLPFRYDVDYCQYGTIYQKKTCIWSSIDLIGFEPKTCPLNDTCQGMFYNVSTFRMRHVQPFDNIPYKDRISIPDQLIVCIVRALLPLITELINTNKQRKLRKRTSFTVNYIESGYIGEDDNIWLKIKFKGADNSEYITMDRLDGEVDDYPFLNASAKQTVLRIIKKHRADQKGMLQDENKQDETTPEH